MVSPHLDPLGGSTANVPQSEQDEPGGFSVRIRPRRGWQPLNLAEIWRFRELMFFLMWRDITVRYKQTVLGGCWALIQPVATMLVFATFFGRFGGMASYVTVPYALFAYTGLLAWTYFATTISQAGTSLVSNTNLISKVYFPRLIIPISAAAVGLVDLGVACTLALVLLVWYEVALTIQVFLLPLFLALVVIAAVGVGTLLAALMVAYRDFRHVLGFTVQLWMLASPVAYPVDVIPMKWRLFYALNPLVGIIDGFRAAILGTPLRWDVIAVSAASAIVVLAIAAFHFRAVERRFADIV
jgi:lipopolysaccharide transport system permease protein